MFNSIKEKLLTAITAHPRLVTLGIGLAVTFVIGIAIGMVDHSAFAAHHHPQTQTMPQAGKIGIMLATSSGV